MSLINTMLRDLDKRRAGEETRQTLPPAVRTMTDGGPRRSLNARYVVWGGVVLLLAATAWWWPGQRPVPAVPSPPAATSMPVPLPPPAPVAVPPAPTLATPLPAVSPRAFQADVRANEPALETVAPAKPATPASTPPANPPTPATAVTPAKIPPVAAVAVDGKQESAAKPKPAPTPSPRPKPTTSPLRMDDQLSTPAAMQAVNEVLKPAPGGSIAMPRLPASSSTDPALASRDADDWSRAQMMLREGRNEQAEPVLQRLLQSKPGNTVARQALLGILLPSRRHAEAIGILSDGLLLNPENVGWAMNLARLHAEANNYAAAWQVLEYSAPNARQNPDYLAFCGTVLQRLNRNGEAIAHYLAALQIKPNEGRWWVGYALALEAEGKAGEAKEAFRRALAVGDLPPEISRFATQKLN